MGLLCFRLSNRPGIADPAGKHIEGVFRDFGVRSTRAVRTSRLYLIELDPEVSDLSIPQRIASELLADPVVEAVEIITPDTKLTDSGESLAVEVHPKPGVMDSVAESTRLALADMGIRVRSVRTGRRFE
ncbi:MAG TPA: phosphoribosylformylglycinamidine synthase subunit PurS, partial [Phycisphaerae bacterium]|nr:phosphoribosylformylglycinamidine synthase subunit PurS [Phycisphaerae bacterium]